MRRLQLFIIFKLTLYAFFSFFFFNDTATTEIYTLSLHDALPISCDDGGTTWFFSSCGGILELPRRRRNRPRPRPGAGPGPSGPGSWRRRPGPGPRPSRPARAAAGTGTAAAGPGPPRSSLGPGPGRR